MNNSGKYQKQFYIPDGVTMDWMRQASVEKPPIWCSVDLRDGNQSLITPMNLDEKLQFFGLLCEIGFKEIEIGFPAASETEFKFCRALIDRNLIPDDVTVQVITQAREHIIERTFSAIRGAKRAIVHLYSSTSSAYREQVFQKDKEEVKRLAVEAAAVCKRNADGFDGELTLEYSPESFTATEPEYALEICNAVLSVWQPTAQNKAIINLPATVENSMPHVYGAQVEYMSKGLSHRESVILSLHPHNDRGTGVAATEFGLLAGGERVEGTLFGNGERTGNADIVTLALNMYAQGVDAGLDFSDLPMLTRVYEETTGMRIPERQPYSGALVFASFSGTHQDAIAKSMKYREERGVSVWNVPYLPIDPSDVGRAYETDVIRINAQSGKGGIGHILETHFHFVLPKKFREAFGYHVKGISERTQRELVAQDLHDIFLKDFVNVHYPVSLQKATFDAEHEFQGVDYPEEVRAKLVLSYGGEEQKFISSGNGRLAAACNALKKSVGKEFTLVSYNEHALEEKFTSKAASYVCIVQDGKPYWGAGIHSDIMASSLNALLSAVNRMLAAEK